MCRKRTTRRRFPANNVGFEFTFLVGIFVRTPKASNKIVATVAWRKGFNILDEYPASFSFSSCGGTQVRAIIGMAS